MSCYKKTMVFALINLFIFAFPAVAYYQPQEGRFMQRDPLGVNPAGGTQNPFAIQKQYSEGLNISEYVRSNPLQYKDALGLCSFNVFGPGISDTSRTITLPDGSIGEAVGEAMITKWDFTVMIWPLPLTMTPLSMIVPRTCEAEVSYWYMRSDDNSHKNHEEGHVFNARVGWTYLQSMAAPYIYKPLCPNKASCYKTAIDQMPAAARALVTVLDAKKDCSEYDRGWCDVAKTWETYYMQQVKWIFDYLNYCDAVY